jgi:hypothetical protein
MLLEQSYVHSFRERTDQYDASGKNLHWIQYQINARAKFKIISLTTKIENKLKFKLIL